MTLARYLAIVAIIAAATAAVLDHARADDRRRDSLRECVDGWDGAQRLAVECITVVDQCRELIEQEACACWRPTP